MTRIIAAVAAIAATLVFAPVAHADDQSYIDALRAAGLPILPWNEGKVISIGYTMCMEMRNGASPEVAGSQFGMYSGLFAQRYADAAQHELCPDTLGN